MSVHVAGAMDRAPCRAPCQKYENMKVYSTTKNQGKRGTFEEDLERCMSHGRGSKRDMSIGDVRRSGRLFLEKGFILEPQIFRFAEMILRDRCSTSYDLASLFRGRRNTLALHSIFFFLAEVA